MKAICIGGAGRICREAALDLVEYSDFEKITIADINADAAREVARWLDDPRVDHAAIDVNDGDRASALIGEYDLALDGTTIALNGRTAACIARAGAHGLNLNGFGDEIEQDEHFRSLDRVFVPGFGMTPGTTNMMVKHAADSMDSVETVRVSHGAFRPIAFSEAITATTVYEVAPELPGRVVYENGRLVRVPPFARPREIELPHPYGTHTQYIIPHSETHTLADFLKDKGVRLIEVRGTWPPANMQLLRSLYDWGFMRNDPVCVDGVTVGVMDVISAYLTQCPEGKVTDLYGCALHVEVIGNRRGHKIRHVLTHTHPASDGSEPGWEKLRAYTRCVGIPLAIGADLIARGRVDARGVVSPEKAFRPMDVFNALQKRRIFIHEDIMPFSIAPIAQYARTA
jgi:saccharopine dehydrogenase-like NADP-dependent oxidoreductase